MNVTEVLANAGIVIQSNRDLIAFAIIVWGVVTIIKALINN